MTSNNGVADKAAVDAATAETAGPLRSITLGNGIVLKVKPVAPRAIRLATQRIPRPEVPIVDIGKGRLEENPDSPTYQRALLEWQNAQGEAALTVGYLLGTEVESVPPGLYRPEEDGWINEIEETFAVLDLDGEPHEAVAIRRTPERARYLDWLRLYAIQDDGDMLAVSLAVSTGWSLGESEVKSAVAAFRRGNRGAVDQRVEEPRGDSDGDRVSTDGAGDGLGV